MKLTQESPKNELKEIILLCKKGVLFGGDIYTQIDEVAMGSPIGPLLAGSFMAELERNLKRVLKDYLTCWKRYVDNTFRFVRNGSVDQL